MKIVWKAIMLCIYVTLILTTHIFIVNFLPYPFNHTNIIFVVLLLLLIVAPSKKIFWLGLVISYFSELLSSIPFGIGTSALLASLLTINWFQLHILTNRSVYMILLSAILGITLYRILFVLLLTIYNYFYNLPGLPYKEILADTGWEVLLSSILLFLMYLFDLKFLKYLHSSARNARMYGKNI